MTVSALLHVLFDLEQPGHVLLDEELHRLHAFFAVRDRLAPRAEHGLASPGPDLKVPDERLDAAELACVVRGLPVEVEKAEPGPLFERAHLDVPELVEVGVRVVQHELAVVVHVRVVGHLRPFGRVVAGLALVEQVLQKLVFVVVVVDGVKVLLGDRPVGGAVLGVYAVTRKTYRGPCVSLAPSKISGSGLWFSSCCLRSPVSEGRSRSGLR